MAGRIAYEPLAPEREAEAGARVFASSGYHPAESGVA